MPNNRGMVNKIMLLPPPGCYFVQLLKMTTMNSSGAGLKRPQRKVTTTRQLQMWQADTMINYMK